MSTETPSRHEAATGFVPPEPALADFHTHTLRSDGILTPAELVTAVAATGVKLLAITDHDTLAGVRELRAAGETPAGLEVIPGIEINTVVVDRDLAEACGWALVCAPGRATLVGVRRVPTLMVSSSRSGAPRENRLPPIRDVPGRKT